MNGSVGLSFVWLGEAVTQIKDTAAIHVKGEFLAGEEYTFLNTFIDLHVLEFT